MRVAQAPQPIDVRNIGVLGILARSDAARSIFERTSALGPDSENVLGNLIAAPVGLAYGHGGLGMLGTGGGECRDRRGRRSASGNSAAAVRASALAASAGARRAWPARSEPGARERSPMSSPVIATVRGNLDREIIRRIIRRHINEVRFCYEQQLAAHRELAGRMVVQFNIAPSGQVLSSVMQSSTLSNVRVESCTLQAVRRWEFPKPEGGGLVNVSYPFVFTPAGGGG